MRINRRRQSEQAPRASESDIRTLALQRTVTRLTRLFKERTVPSDKALDALADVTDADIESAVSFWDDSQGEAGTGLAGLLDARTRD